MEHPNATAFRTVMDAVSRGDVAAMHAALHEDFLNINDIGAGPWREVHGRDAFFDFFGQFVEYLEGTFRQELLEVIGYDDRVLAVVHETATRQGHVFDNRAIYLCEIVDGRWASLRTMDMDHDNINRFWDAVGMPTVTKENDAMSGPTTVKVILDGTNVRAGGSTKGLDDNVVAVIDHGEYPAFAQAAGEEIVEKHGGVTVRNFWWVLLRTHDGVDGWVSAVRIGTGDNDGLIPGVPHVATVFDVGPAVLG